MASKECIFKFESEYSGPLNPAFVTMHYDTASAVTLSEFIARCVVFYLFVCPNVTEGEVRLMGCQVRDDGASGVVDYFFPQTQYDTLRNEIVQPSGLLPILTNWGFKVHTGPTASTGRGDSLCMPIRGATAGRSHSGRIFLPFLGTGAVADNGLIRPNIADNLKAYFSELLLGAALTSIQITGGAALLPAAGLVIFSRKLLTTTAAASVNVTKVPSRLRSRTK